MIKLIIIYITIKIITSKLSKRCGNLAAKSQKIISESKKRTSHHNFSYSEI